MNIKKTLITLLLTVFSLSSFAEDWAKNENCPQFYPMGKPVLIGVDNKKIENRAFSVCAVSYATYLDPEKKISLWSAAVLNGQEQGNHFIKRKDQFQPNPHLPKQVQATFSDYIGTKLDKGHLEPAGNMITDQAMFESFYFNNIVPQVGPNMNRGIWVDLEKMVRLWSIKRGQVAVFTGPLFSATSNVTKIGRTGVWVPEYLYKVVLDLKTKEVIAFVIPNNQIVTRKVKSLDAGNPLYPQTLPQNAVNCGRVCSLDNFIVSLEQLESFANIRFFPNLKLENGKEYKMKSKMWHADNKRGQDYE